MSVIVRIAASAIATVALVLGAFALVGSPQDSITSTATAQLVRAEDLYPTRDEAVAAAEITLGYDSPDQIEVLLQFLDSRDVRVRASAPGRCVIYAVGFARADAESGWLAHGPLRGCDQ